MKHVIWQSLLLLIMFASSCAKARQPINDAGVAGKSGFSQQRFGLGRFQ